MANLLSTTVNGSLNVQGSSMYVTASQLHIGKASSGTAQMSFESWGSYTGAIAMNSSGAFHWGGQGNSEWYFKKNSTYNGDYSASGTTVLRIASDGNIYSAYYGDWLSNVFNSKQNASTAITTSNIGSQSVNYASSAGNADTVDGYHASSFTYVPTWTSNTQSAARSNFVSGGNWYRIANLGTERFFARVRIYDDSSGGPHSSVEFQVAGAFNASGGYSFNLTSNGYYSAPSVTQVRILSKSTYDPQYLEVYISYVGYVPATFVVSLLEARNASVVNWDAGSIPAGYSATTWDANAPLAVGGRPAIFNSGIYNTSDYSRLGNVLVGQGTYKNTIKPIDDANLNIQTPSGAVYFDTYGQASGSFRAPIFYDSGDTGYYLDPNDTSNLNQLNTATRTRWNMPRYWTNRTSYTSDEGYWTGTNGWGTNHGTWASAWQGGFSGWDIWGTGTDHPQGAGYVHAQGIVSGQHYANSSVGYGWMMVGAANATANRYWLRGKWDTTTSGWVEMITTGNIASQSVSYADESGYSASSGSVEWTSVQNKPATFPPSSHNHDDRYYTETESDGRYLYYRGINASNDFQTYQSSPGVIRFDQVNDINTHSNPPGGYTYGGVLSMRGGNFGFQLWGSHTGDFYFKTQWNDDQYSGWRYVVHSGNIGSQSVNYATTAGNTNSISNSTGNTHTWTGANYFRTNNGGYLGSLSSAPLQVYSDSNNSAYMSFHKGGYYAVNLGLDADNVMRIGGWSAASNRWELDMSGNNTVAGSFRAPIFYDSNDTTYYLDPNAGTSLKIAGGIVSTAANGAVLLKHENSEANAWIFQENAANWGLFWFNAGGQSGQTIGSYTTVGAELFGMNNAITGYNPNSAWSGTDANTRAAWMLSNYGGYLWTQGTQYSETDMRAPIFYDSNNTGYYGDFASTSVMNAIRFGTSTNNGTLSGNGDWGVRLTTDAGWIQFGPANSGWAHMYSNLNFYMNTHLWVSGGYKVAAWDYNNGGGALYATVFYDANDTGYYVDPNGMSKQVQLTNLGTYGSNASNARNHFVQYNAGTASPTTGWIAAAFGDAGANRVVIGQWGSTTQAIIGSHTGSLNDWGELGYVATSHKFYAPSWDSSVKLEVNTNGVYAPAYRGNANVGGTGTATWHPDGIYCGSTMWQYGVQYKNNTGIYNLLELQLNNGFTISQGDSNYASFNSWVYLPGAHGFFSAVNGAHLYPNNATYGSWRIAGSRNGWHGIHFDSGSTLMMNSAETGIHREGYGWQFRWYNGSMYVSRGTYGGGTEYTVIDSGTIGSQSVSYASSAGGVSWANVSSKPATWLNEPNLIQGSEPDTIRASGFYESYLGSGNPTGTWMNYINVRHSNTANGHGFQLGMSYYDNNLWFRSYSGNIPPSFQSWSRALGTNTDPYPSNMNQYVRTTDDVTHNSTTSPTFVVNNHSDNTKGYRIHNTSGSSVSAMFTNSSNQLVIAAGAFDQINLNKKVYVNGVALGVNVTPSATAGRIDASNDIVAYSSSDERLKYNITPIENAIEKVKSLTGVEFDWKPEYKHAHGYEGHDTGIIAQQVQEVIPSAVRTNDTGFLAVRYEKLIGLLIEANKELAARVEELEKKLG